jgi:hypothetical protein
LHCSGKLNGHGRSGRSIVIGTAVFDEAAVH